MLDAMFSINPCAFVGQWNYYFDLLGGFSPVTSTPGDEILGSKGSESTGVPDGRKKGGTVFAFSHLVDSSDGRVSLHSSSPTEVGIPPAKVRVVDSGVRTSGLVLTGTECLFTKSSGWCGFLSAEFLMGMSEFQWLVHAPLKLPIIPRMCVV